MSSILATVKRNLGLAYALGRGGFPKDDTKAVELLSKAAEQGDANAQCNLGIMYAQGRGGLVKDTTKAIELYRKSAEQGNANAQCGLGLAYAQGRGGLVKDSTKATELLTKARASSIASVRRVAEEELAKLGELHPVWQARSMDATSGSGGTRGGAVTADAAASTTVVAVSGVERV